MLWSEDMDLAMLKEMAAEGVMGQKPKSRDRGTAWQNVVNQLNQQPAFDVSVRSLRDRFSNLTKKYKAKVSKEKRSTGGGECSFTETEKLLEELIQIGEEAEKRSNEKSSARSVMEEERGKALEMRKRAMETMGETSSRNGESSGGKKRRSYGQSMEMLEKVIGAKKEMMEVERKEREKEREQQQQQQQQMCQQFGMMQQCMIQLMEQQQRQTDMMLELFKNLSK